MIKLYPIVTKNLETLLEQHHQLYKKIRCKAEYLEEIIVLALRSSDFAVDWDPASHDKEKDIVVNSTDKIQIKSGSFTKTNNTITISGHRLGRFEGDLIKITNYLNKSSSDIISVFNPDKTSKKNLYTVASISKEVLKGIKPDKWIKKNTTYTQTNSENVEFSIRISMSWQIWWQIPADKANIEAQLSIN